MRTARRLRRLNTAAAPWVTCATAPWTRSDNASIEKNRFIHKQPWASSKLHAQPRRDGHMLVEQRQELLLQELRATGAVRVAELAERFGVSAGTIRRDIAELADLGR
ncbi:DeoR family transcriptional regulator, partial [Streptomyces harbinensis]|uniref:DeoR family transcriptional regulator n=1 Tax=Streptomyces harbinensis TaxID=1176198 RepID=UPI0034DF85C3